MKYLLIFLLTATVYAQTDVNVNVLSETEFEAIQINGHTISQIRATNGQKAQMQNLYGPAIEYKGYNSGKSKEYTYDDFTLAFSAWVTSSNTPVLSSFKITGPSVTITINNIEFSAGDNIAILSSLNLIENSGGNYLPGIKEYIVSPCEKCNHFIYISFNTSSQLITEVGYLELT